jgi:hypothetical protein
MLVSYQLCETRAQHRLSSWPSHQKHQGLVYRQTQAKMERNVCLTDDDGVIPELVALTDLHGGD